MNKRILSGAFLIALLGMCSSCTNNDYTLSSPDGNLVMQLHPNEEGEWTYSFQAEGTPLINESELGFDLVGGDDIPGEGWKVNDVSKREVRDVWKPIWGKRTEVDDHFNEVVLELSRKGAFPEKITLVHVPTTTA